jgi:hypothetical protein
MLRIDYLEEQACILGEAVGLLLDLGAAKMRKRPRYGQ